MEQLVDFMRLTQQGLNRAAPGLIWGFDFTADERHLVDDCDDPPRGGVRWLHLNLADYGTHHWLERAAGLPPAARELLTAQDAHQRALVEDGAIALVLNDFERDFDVQDTGRIGAIRLALTPSLIVSARTHPVGSADIVKRRLSDGAPVDGAARALDLLVSAVFENIGGVVRRLSSEVQAAEDALIDERHPPSGRQLIEVRRRLAQLHRMLTDTRGLLRRLEQDRDLPEPLRPTIEMLSQRAEGLDGDAMSVQGQLRVLRDELDHQQNVRINQNLYLLSVVTVMTMPVTLVTSYMGMNSGGLPLAGPGGTLAATLLALGGSAAIYMFLRRRGFFR